MINALRPSLSSLRRTGKSLSASASNTATARSTAKLDALAVDPAERPRPPGGRQKAPDEHGDRPLRVGRESVAGGGVGAVIREAMPSHVAAFAPGGRDADAAGMAARSNVDLAQELLRIRGARQLYRADLKAVTAEDEMAGLVIDDRA